MRFPKGYEDPNSDNYKRLTTKGIIYEVKLLDWVERVDIEADGMFLKTYIHKPDKKEWEKPTDRDEIAISVRIYYEEGKDLYSKDNWETNMQDS